MVEVIEFSGCKMFVDDSQNTSQLIMQNGLNYEAHIRRELERHHTENGVALQKDETVRHAICLGR